MKSQYSDKWIDSGDWNRKLFRISPVLLFFMLLISFSAQSQQQDSIKIQKRDSLTFLQKQQTRWSKADSANHRANAKIDSVQSVMNKSMRPDLTTLAQKLKSNSKKKQAEKKKADTVKNGKCDSTAAKKKSTQDIKKEIEQISRISNKLANDVLNPDLHKIGNNIKKKRAQRLAAKAEKDTTVMGRNGNDSLDVASHTEQKSDSSGRLRQASRKYITIDTLTKLRPTGAVQEVKSVESKLASTEDKLSNKMEEPINEATKKLNAPVNKVSEKTNTGLSKLSNEAMGKSDLPANVNLPGINSSGTNSLTSSLTKDLDLPASEVDENITEKIKDSPGNLLESQKAELNMDKVKGDIDNPLKDKLEQRNKLKKELDGNVKDKMESFTDSQQLNGIKEQGIKVNVATDKVQGYSKDIENIKKGDVEKVDELKKDAMNNLPAKEFGNGQEQVKTMDQEMEKMMALKNKEAFKKQTMAKAREEVVQQIITQHSTMMQTVDKISVYQKQGGAMASMIKGLPARPVKSRRPPLIERFVPGITLQVQKGNKWFIDLNPTLRFKVRSILSTGLGYNYRTVFEQSGKYKREERIFGFRSFTEFSIRKGLSIRADIERMSAYVPLIYAQPDVKERKYVWSCMIGLRKDFGLGAGVLGNIQFMYNIYDPKKESPYLNRLNVRFGFEFPMKKKSGRVKGN